MAVGLNVIKIVIVKPSFTLYNDFMPEDFPQTITSKTQEKFTISESGLYAISVTARCDKKDDLRIEVDAQLFREIPPEKNIQKFDIPPAWNGTKLKGRSQTNIFLLQLGKGEHVIEFIPEGQAKVEKFSYWQIEDPTHIEFNLDQQAEEGDKRPWFTFALVDLPLKSIEAEVTVNWHYFDGEDVKLIIDNAIEKNSTSLLWKNWLWHATPKQLLSCPRKEQKVVTRDFSDDTDQMILARVLFGEARSTLVPDEARMAIGWVIKNRVISTGWPDTYLGVITKPKHFSAFNLGDDNRPFVEDPLHKNNEIDKNAWEHTYDLARKIIEDEIPDPTQGANHYYDDSIGTPDWAKDQKPSLTISYINQYEEEVSIFFLNL